MSEHGYEPGITHLYTNAGRFIFERRSHAHGSNLADQEQPSLIVYTPWRSRLLMGGWSLICIPEEQGGRPHLTALEATNEQIAYALTNDESVFA